MTGLSSWLSQLASCMSMLALVICARPAVAQTPTDFTTSIEIIANTVSAAPACLTWRIEGGCVWLTCTPFGCKTSTSVRVAHYQPVTVTSAWMDVPSHPWSDVGLPWAATLARYSQQLLGQSWVDYGSQRSRINQGHNRAETSPRRTTNRQYREVDSLGHPGGLVEGVVSGTGLLCPSVTTVGEIYHHSILDTHVWRNFISVEALYPATYIPFLRNIGMGFNTWGPVHPRIGFVSQQNAPKAGAVFAQRSGDIITRPGEPHIYSYINRAGIVDNFIFFDLYGPLMEANPATGWWQMLTPVRKSFCEPFGINDVGPNPAWGDFAVSGTGSYAFALWLPVSCCEIKGTTLIYWQ
jgi:integrating conjugative element protein (TIGR03756 family)